MSRKVFISFLGYTNYRKCRYYKGNFVSEEVRFIQEATLDYLLCQEKWEETDVAYILLTEGARIKNWEDDGHRNPANMEIIHETGLRSRLAMRSYPFQVIPIEGLPDGKNESELFEIFRKVFEVLQPEDNLYFDVTHGFRSLPMLALVLMNYAKFLKSISVRSITYGNYEAKIAGSDGEADKAPIIDMLPLSAIQDWTFAAADFLKNGNAIRFKELVVEHKSAVCRGWRDGDKDNAQVLNGLANSLVRLMNDFQTCRLKEIYEGRDFSRFNANMETVKESVIEPINPILRKLKVAFERFTTSSHSPESELTNGFEAAKWCIDHNLYQQAATILQENIVSFFCIRYGLNVLDHEERSFINTAFAYHVKLNSKNTEAEEKKRIMKELESNELISRIFNDSLIADYDLYKTFGSLTEERNDINHAGMRESHHDAGKIRENIEKAFYLFEKKLLKK